jgi:hypothetical protein
MRVAPFSSGQQCAFAAMTAEDLVRLFHRIGRVVVEKAHDSRRRRMNGGGKSR